MRIKYATLLVPYARSLPKSQGQHFFSDQTYFIERSFAESITSAQVSHWERWIGELEWERLGHFSTQLVSWVPTNSPGILDGENKLVTARLQGLWNALLMSGPINFSGERPVLLTGDGEVSNGFIQPLDVRQLTNFDALIPSDWIRENKVDKQFFEREGEAKFFDNWEQIYNYFVPDESQERSGAPFLFGLGFFAFRYGLEARLADFRIPNFIRAAETILAIPKGSGAPLFASRAIGQLPAWAKTAIGLTPNELENYLKDLYQIRSDSVHGKPFAWTAQKEYGITPADFPVYAKKADGISALVACGVLQSAIFNSAFTGHLDDRGSLEAQWSSDKIPQV